MDDARFDAWTRRRFGLVVGGGTAVLLGLSVRDESAAKKRKKRCRRVNQACQPGNRNRRCCNTLRCEEDLGLGGHRCCRPLRGHCEEESDCCAGDGVICHTNECCRAQNATCHSSEECCAGTACFKEDPSEAGLCKPS